ncbi:glutathione S-transferase family protein [Paracoccaceae bacterium GXU_MW_L88]
MSYRVLGSPVTRAMRVYWLLEELGEPYEMIRAMPASNDAKASNPTGRVPALLLEDGILTESVAIMQFLADRHDAFTFPVGTMERARQDEALHFGLDRMDATLWMAARHSFARPEELRVPAVKDSLRWEWNNAMEELEGLLGDQEFIAGEFSIADILLVHCAGWARVAKFDLPGGKVGDYFKRISKRPAYAKLREQAKG